MQKKKQSLKKAPLHRQASRHAKMAIVPHRGNQFRPHAVRMGSLVGLFLAIVLLNGVYNWSQSGSVLGATAMVTPSELAAHLNRERQQNATAELQYSIQLADAAHKKAQDMLRQQYWAHEAPDGTTPWKWLGEVNYNYSYAGENLAKNFTSATAVTAAWMASPDHRKNMLDAHYTEVGFAVVDGSLQGKQTKLVVALFAAPAGSTGVAGVTQHLPSLGGMSPIAQFGVALQSSSPVALGSAVLLLFAAVVALVAHSYRKQLPLPIRRSWRYHHGLYKSVGLTTLAVVVIALYSGGQI